jgi:hypothetical protein
LATSEDILLAIREDLELATREDFFMAMDSWHMYQCGVEPLAWHRPCDHQLGCKNLLLEGIFGKR